MLDPKEALFQIRKQITPIQETEKVGLLHSLGRVLACTVVAPRKLPEHRNSAMDGYALSFTDLAQVETFKVIGTSSAGHPFLGDCKNGECVRIMTGAVVPRGTDTVVMQEHTSGDMYHIHVEKNYQQGANIRHPGEDVKEGANILPQGTCIKPTHLGLLAALGISEMEVFRLPKIIFFSTGDELVPLGQTLQLGQIYDANRYMLYGLFKTLGIEPVDAGVLPDHYDTIREKLQLWSSTSDLLITTGGVSVGKFDYVKPVLEAMGEIFFWKVAMKPGKPLTFGKMNRAYFFGLPGNPVSATITFMQFVKPALDRWMGKNETVPLEISLPCIHSLKKEPGRVDFQRGVMTKDPMGMWVVSSAGSQSSGALSTLARANCTIVLPKESGDIPTGTHVTVQPWDVDFFVPTTMVGCSI